MIDFEIDRYETFMSNRKVVYIGSAKKVRGLWYQTKPYLPTAAMRKRMKLMDRMWARLTEEKT